MAHRYTYIVVFIVLVAVNSKAGMLINSFGSFGAGGGGGGTERLTPDGDGATLEWTDGFSGPNFYTAIDEAWASRGDTNEIASTTATDVTIHTFSNVSSMGAGDTCTQLSIDYYGKDGNTGSDVTVEIAYDVGGGFIGTQTIGPLASGANADYNTTYYSLSLTQTQVNALQIRLTNNSGTVAACETLSVEITYE